MKTKKQARNKSAVRKEVGLRATDEQLEILNRASEIFASQMGINGNRKRNFFILHFSLKAARELIEKEDLAKKKGVASDQNS